ncbi:unnamed protein product [Rotaria sordida]|uniref:Antistasin-like domain-containing protein n=1 Tax=Rotaria sordida TaxID=392033 RepID=A0A814F9L4_9BILA|nr:unnamed protein product [Rotaria sordida]CAF1121345.1 unnamed protein product [Rotaria sordida]CAF1122649.1 unnamed protein product [Rotaria sordida]
MAMYSVGILCIVLLTLAAITNAVRCPPLMCALNCDYGFQLDSRGCPMCRCSTLSQDCVEPISGYNCGSIDHRDCPGTHYCQLDSTGLRGQCCLAIA